MTDHSTAKTLIIDARDHHGGGLEEMDVMFPYLFAVKTRLLTLDTREAVVKAQGDPFGDVASVLPQAGAPRGVVRRAHYALPGKNTALLTAKVYVLTSHQTASSAEHMSLALKRTHRAILIGETTAGAGNYGDFIALGDGYRAFVPMGRTFDPDTGKGWEATGVTPDIAVPAGDALGVALDKAGAKGDASQLLGAMR
jgi:C-terminal processing protease CtpA/Prc